jgi:uncharacterized membrane protein
MRATVRGRFWIELGLAALFAVSAILTLLIPDWVEVFFGIEPDEGSGTLEIAITVGLLVLAVLFTLAARIEIRTATASRDRRTTEIADR